MSTKSSAILFPGQGAQALGMGLDVAAADPAAAAVFENANDTLGFDLRAVVAGDDKAALDRTDICQPAILVTSLAVMAALDRRGLLDRATVTACAGLSLGEYSALTWAGALAIDDAVRLVRLRGEAMQRASDEHPSGMLSLVGATLESATELCDAARGSGVLVVANLLAPGQVAVAGTHDALERAQSLLKEHGIRKAVPLSVAGAFHSPCMASASAALSDALASTDIARPTVPVVMNVTGESVDEPETIRDLLRRQVTSPVRWQGSMERLVALGVTDVLEPAPGKQLSNMLRRYEVSPAVATCGDANELAAFTRWPGDQS